MKTEDETGVGAIPNSSNRHPTAIVEAEWLMANLDNPLVVTLEVFLKEPTPEEDLGHIPNSRRVNWKTLVWESKRREFADPKTLSRRLEELGVPGDAEIVICGDPIQFGTYAYMALKMAGNERVRILNGGKQRWMDLGLPLTREESTYTRTQRLAGPLDSSVIVGRDEVLASLGSSEVQILDVRSDEEYAGERVSPRAAVIDNGAQAWGRIPGAKHLFFGSLLDKDGRFLDKDALVVKFKGAGIDLERPVFLYCRLGHRASLAWFALSEIAGCGSSRVYDGSWTEWGSMVGMPVER